MKQMVETSDRIGRLFSDPVFKRVPAVLLVGQPNIYYFTNFTGHDSWAILTPTRTVLLTDGRYTLQAEQESPQARIVVRKGAMLPVFEKVLTQSRLRRLGFLAEDVTVDLHNRMAKACRKTKFLPLAAGPVHKLRQIKSPTEIDRICRAIAVAEAAFTELLRHVKPGRTENEVAAELEYRMRRHGAEKAGFETIVAGGANGAKPHARTTDTPLKAKQLVTFDFGALAGGYGSDLTRTVALGTMPRDLKDVYRICLEAQMAAVEAVGPGVRCRDVDAVARRIITRAGYGKYFNHGTGHGLGLEVHEAPALNRITEQTLEPGMVVTIEPGIYLPGLGGVRIEDDVLVTAAGHQVLTSLPKAADQVVI